MIRYARVTLFIPLFLRNVREEETREEKRRGEEKIGCDGARVAGVLKYRPSLRLSLDHYSYARLAH